LIDREKEIDEIHEKLKIECIISIVGRPGLGKSQVVNLYIQKKGDYYLRIIYLNSEFLSILTTQVKNYVDLFDSSKIDEKTTAKQIFEIFYELLSNDRCLIVFDNVVNYKMIEIFLPKKKPNINVIITSRDRSWTPKFELQKFTDELTKTFIIKILGVKYIIEDEDVIKLNKELDGLPLALVKQFTTSTM
jgi:hypothetical protein